MTQANHSSQHRSDIQAFRGVAVIAVILFHAFPTVFPKGYLGVDLFFVISGFVMTPQIVRIFQKENDSEHYIFPKLRSFYIRRFQRLAPAFGVFVRFTCVIVFFFGNIADHARFTMQGIYSILLFGNVGALRFSGDYFNSNPNPLVHLWSLSTEEQIYFFIPLYLFACVSFFRIKIFSENLFKKFVLVAMCSCLVLFYLSTHVITVLSFFIYLNYLGY